ncbi:MAG: TonB-dependent receptor [Novosphingobium sp.]|nr:TonB-dependent receptor [Novosphingobium sp.]
MKLDKLVRASLLASVASACVVTVTPAFAQDTSAPQKAEENNDEGIIIVTGSILRRTDIETPAPVSILSTEALESRGINTIAEGIQRLAANGSGTISEGWNNGNNFAAGAVAASLRGLTVQKTLTVFDGLRMAPYPLADDGHRNFVDMGTIPDIVVDRIEVLKDGASSTYGADAVAGVINVIAKKEIQGVHANLSAGVSEKGDGGEQRLDLAAGYGDLDNDGFNIYIGGSYRKNSAIYARDRKYPWNSGDNSAICNDDGSCMAIGTRWYTFGVNANGTLGGSTIPLAPVVAPSDETGNRNGVKYTLLNPNCALFKSSPVTVTNSTYGPNLCQADFKQLYGTVRPETERYGFAARATARIGDKAEAYISGNYWHTHTYSQLSPAAFNDQTPPPTTALLSPLILPIYVCSAGVGTIDFDNGYNTSTGCDATNGVLNPNNPFAAEGKYAVLRGRLLVPRTVETNARSLRASAGIDGTFGSSDEWNYSVNFTASEVRLSRVSENYIIPQRVADVVADGSYNFVNPTLNSQEVLDYIAPRNQKESTSKLWQAQAVLGRTLFQLPGGDLQAAVGVSYRKESINDQSANPDNTAHPYDRYYTINAVGAVGSRNVKSAFYEISAPVIDQLEISASGRYDDYSSGQSNFSPKFGAKFKPIEQVLLRGTWSKGFRIPSFNESYGLPTTGYVELQLDCTKYAAYCASHDNNNYVTNTYQLGRTSIGNPALSPEKSTSWTLGVVFEPIRNLSFTIDYFNITVKDLIGNVSSADQDAALDAYLLNGITDAVPGVTIVPDIPDTAFPNARPNPKFIQFSFSNSDKEHVEGIDFGVNYRKDFGAFRFSTSLDASYLMKYAITRNDGSVERYDGTLSPCDYTSCSGSPKWRATWSSTIGIGKVDITPTVYYTGGYDTAAVDYGSVKGECDPAIGFYQDGTPVRCKIGAQWNVDLNVNLKVNDQFSLYMNALNVLGIDPKFDPSAAYGIFNYNPAWGQPNIVGRYLRVGAKVDF